MEDQTRASVHVHMEGPSRYHCDQTGDSATITLGRGSDVALTADIKNFLSLAEVCKQAATRITTKLSKEEEAPA